MPLHLAPKAFLAAVALVILIPAVLVSAWFVAGIRDDSSDKTDLNTSSVRQLENSALPLDYIDVQVSSSQQETVIRVPSTGNAGTLPTSDRGIEITLVLVGIGVVAAGRWMTGRPTRQ